MDQIVNLVVKKTGISHEHARTAVETVLGFLKERLPAPLAGQIDSVISGEGASGEGGAGLGDMAKKLGGNFGK